MKDSIPKFALLGAMIFVTLFLNNQSRGEFKNSAPNEEILSTNLVAAENGTIVKATSSEQASVAVLDSTSSLILDAEGVLAKGGLNSADSLDLPKELAVSAGNDFKSGSLQKNSGGVISPAVDAAAATVLDLETGAPYFNYNEKNRWPTASLTKLMTAVVALKNMDMKQVVEIKDEDLKFLGDVSGEFKVGQKFVLGDLIRVMLVISSNEAAEAIAGAYGRDAFLKAMNDQANDFGLYDTHFNDPTGLSVSNQSTASDLYSLAREVYTKFPELFNVTRKTEISIKEAGSQKTTQFTNINSFAGKKEFLGGKTGFTDEAQGNLISIFSMDNRPVVIVVLGTRDRFGESDKLWQWVKSNYGHQ